MSALYTSTTYRAPRTAASPSEEPGPVQLAPCDETGCTAFRPISQEIVAAGEQGKLIKAKLLGGSSSIEGSPLEWNTYPHEITIFCAEKLPSILIDTEEGWQVDVIDFEHLSQVQIASRDVYGYYCHPEDENFPLSSRSYGYRAIPEEYQGLMVEDPQELFAIAAKR